MTALEFAAGLALHGLSQLTREPPRAAQAPRRGNLAVVGEGRSRTRTRALTGRQLDTLRVVCRHGRGALVNASTLAALERRGLVTLHERDDGRIFGKPTRRGRALAAR